MWIMGPDDLAKAWEKKQNKKIWLTKVKNNCT